MGYGPLASIPYTPVVLLIPAVLMFFFQSGVANILSILCFLVGWVGNSYMATKVGDKVKARLFRGESVSLIVFGYYTPLFLIIIGVGIAYLVMEQ